MSVKKFLISMGSIAGLVVVLSAVVVVTSMFQSVESDQIESYSDSHTYSFALGQTASLDSSEDEEGKAYDWEAGFSWSGTLAATLNDVMFYRPGSKGDFNGLVDEDGKADFSSEEIDSSVLLVAIFKIKNIDAKKIDADSSGFNASVFLPDAAIAAVPSYVDFGDAALKKATEKDGFSFYLDQGKESIIKLGWVIPESELSSDMKITVGATGNEKYFFTVTPSDIKEGRS